MDTHAWRGLYRVGTVPQVDGTSQTELVADVCSGPSDGMLDGIVVETNPAKRITPVVRQSSPTGSYDRNAHRRHDEKTYHRKRRKLFYAVPTGVFIGVIALVIWGPFAVQPKSLSSQQATTLSVSARPDIVPLAVSSDVQPAEGYLQTYTVASNRARIVMIDSLSVKARVLEVGTDGRNLPQLPRNSYDVGWYNVSVAPGESGATVLSGACSGSVGQGVFRRIGELSEGAEITVEMGNGTVLRYAVQSVASVVVESVDMTEVLRPLHGTEQGMSLVGCSGTYDAATNDFAGRVIVRAIRI